MSSYGVTRERRNTRLIQSGKLLPPMREYLCLSQTLLRVCAT